MTQSTTTQKTSRSPFRVGDFVEATQAYKPPFGWSGSFPAGTRGLITSYTPGQTANCYGVATLCTAIFTYTIELLQKHLDTLFECVDMTPEERVHFNNPQKLLPYGARGYSLGADPEVFAVSTKTGRVRSAYKFLPSKEDTHGVYYLPFWDGFQAEFTVAPNTCLAYLTDHVYTGLAALQKALPPNTKLTHKSVVELTSKTLREAAPDEVRLGCAPSTNIYGSFVPSVYDPRTIHIRTSGCHFHFGMSVPDPERMVRMMDRVAGVAITAILGDLQDPRRRKLYGRAGEYRLPPHGLEWRVPGSEVLIAPAVFHLCFDLARMAARLGEIGQLLSWETTDEETQHAINDYDLPLCRKIIQRNAGMFGSLCKAIYNQNTVSNFKSLPLIDKHIMTLVDKGISQFVDLDLAANWMLAAPASRGWITHSASKSCQFSSFVETFA